MTLSVAHLDSALTTEMALTIVVRNLPGDQRYACTAFRGTIPQNDVQTMRVVQSCVPTWRPILQMLSFWGLAAENPPDADRLPPMLFDIALTEQTCAPSGARREAGMVMSGRLHGRRANIAGDLDLQRV